MTRNLSTCFIAGVQLVSSIFDKKTVQSQGRPRDAAVNFDRYRDRGGGSSIRRGGKMGVTTANAGMITANGKDGGDKEASCISRLLGTAKLQSAPGHRAVPLPQHDFLIGILKHH